MTNIISAIIISNLLIYIFYKFFKTGWPEGYFTENDKVGLIISVTPIRFVIFRILPIFGIISAVFASFKVNGDLVKLGVYGTTCSLIHLATTNLLAIFKIYNQDKSIKIFVNKANQMIYHLITIITITTTGFFAGIFSTSEIVIKLSPTRQGLIDNLWSSLIFSILLVKAYGFYIYRRENSIESIIRKSIDSIKNNKNIYNSLLQNAKKYNANFDLVEAICVGENIQRPKWFRKIEYFLPNGSYGIMQVKSDKKINDIESINIGVKKYFKETNKKMTINEFEKIILSYNNSQDYVELIHRIMNEIDSKYQDEFQYEN